MPRFICLLHMDDTAFAGFTPEDQAAFDAANGAFDRELIDKGQYVYGSAMTLPRDAVVVRRRNDKVSATDGPFAETKEHLGGFIIIETSDRDEAVEIVKRDPMASHASIEILEIKDVSDPDWAQWAARAYGPR